MEGLGVKIKDFVLFMEKIICDIGITAYNEEKNIGFLLKSIQSQILKNIEISHIYVVASGCTDKTEEVVKTFSAFDRRIKLIHQDTREGKYSAINVILKKSQNEIIVVCSADIILDRQAVEKLVSPFKSPEVGACGAHPIPRHRSSGLLGFATRLLWNLHHKISLETPKIGEMIGFRKSLIERLPPTSVDEAYIEYRIRSQGYKIVYVPDSLVYNRVPHTLKDFIIQRRRIACGHLHLQRKLNYKVSTFSTTKVLKFILREIFHRPKDFFLIMDTVIFEGLSRVLGWWDYFTCKEKHIVWRRISD